MLRGYQEALQAAVVGISDSRLKSATARDRAALARRIETALDELDKLRSGGIPDYSNPDVALFYSHWYLPEQVNLAYSLSTGLLRQRREGVHGQSSIQLVDFGAGSGAMILGLTLAIAEHVPRERWPEVVGVYQIDVPAMLDLGEEIWRALGVEAGRRSDLQMVSELMSRTLFERTGALPESAEVWCWTGAERWLTALHVVYEETLRNTAETYRTLRDGIQPHMSLVTAPELKASRIADAKPVDLRLSGVATGIRAHRSTLVTDLYGHLNTKARNYLRGEIRWASRYGNKRPVANTAVRNPTPG